MWPPTPDTIETTPVDLLAVAWLRDLVAKARGGGGGSGKVHPVTAANDALRTPSGDYSGDRRMLRLLGEAWDWLVLNGLVSFFDMADHSSAGWSVITRRGYHVADDPDAAKRIRAEIRLGVELHPRIKGVVQTQFATGDYETAVFVAMREVEIRVRELSGESNAVIGVPLMTAAFNPRGGPLCDTSLDPGEQEALMALFRGAMGVFKNPSSHRAVGYDDPTEASEVVLFADLLMRILDRVPRSTLV